MDFDGLPHIGILSDYDAWTFELDSANNPVCSITRVRYDWHDPRVQGFYLPPAAPG